MGEFGEVHSQNSLFWDIHTDRLSFLPDTADFLQLTS